VKFNQAIKRVCIVTVHGLSEPRGVRHALAAKKSFPHAEVFFVFFRQHGPFSDSERLILNDLSDINCMPIEFPTRQRSPMRWAFHKILTLSSVQFFILTGIALDWLFSDRIVGLRSLLKKLAADIYFAHNFETILPAASAAKSKKSHFVFDCMEFYSDMGDGQSKFVSRAIHDVERKNLPAASLITTASPEISEAYKERYNLINVQHSYNCSKIISDLPLKKEKGLSLYWRNSVLGLGQRGLEDVLLALPNLHAHVKLYIQGQLGHDGGSALLSKINSLGLDDRVIILGAHLPGEAVVSAARFDVGLCLERKGPRNHDLTVSNKMFDYHMAGLAVIASDLPGLRNVIQNSGGGLLYEPGNVDDLIEKIDLLSHDKALLNSLQSNSRSFAMSDANYELELLRVSGRLCELTSGRERA